MKKSLLVIIMLLLCSGSAFATVQSIERVGGADRYETSAALAVAAFVEANTVIIARGDDAGGFADGLAASVLAGKLKAPVVLVGSGGLRNDLKDAIQRVGAANAVILGGEQAVSAQLEDALRSELGLSVSRIMGNNRIETAAKISLEGATGRTAFVVNGFAGADALVAGAKAYQAGYAVLMVGKDTVPAVTKETLEVLEIDTVYIVGGTAVVSSAVQTELAGMPGLTVHRLSGEDRYETSAVFAASQFPGEDRFAVVGGMALADAVGASVFGFPVLYVRPDTVPVKVRTYLDTVIKDGSYAIILGGKAVVAEALEETLLIPQEIQDWIANSRNLFLAQSRELKGIQYVLVTYGQQPTGGYVVEMTNVDVQANKIAVTVSFKKPNPDDFVTQALTYPYHLIRIPATGLPVEFTPVGDEFHIMSLVGTSQLKPIVEQTHWIKLFGPAPGASVARSFSLDGVASVYEGTILYRLKTDGGTLLSSGFATAAMGDWGYFTVNFTVPATVPAGSGLVLQVYTESAKDGSVDQLIELPLTLQ